MSKSRLFASKTNFWVLFDSNFTQKMVKVTKIWPQITWKRAQKSSFWIQQGIFFVFTIFKVLCLRPVSTVHRTYVFSLHETLVETHAKNLINTVGIFITRGEGYMYIIYRGRTRHLPQEENLENLDETHKIQKTTQKNQEKPRKNYKILHLPQFFYCF